MRQERIGRRDRILSECMVEIGKNYACPGNADERIHIFLATDLAPAKQALEEDEMLQVHEMDIKDAVEMIYSGEIQDGKTIVGLLMATYHEPSYI